MVRRATFASVVDHVDHGGRDRRWLALLPAGARRRDLWTRWERLLDAGFGERVFPFDRAAALVYGELFARRQRAGRPGAAFDLQIAAIAAHRNVADFEGCGVRVINPWSVSKPA